MAPLTRCRADPTTFAPTDLVVEYYGQRSSAGLVVSEATVICERARGFPNTPGVYNAAQVEGWKKVAAKLHEGGSLLSIQLWHQGRTASSKLMGKTPLGPSAIAYRTMSGEMSEVPEVIPAEMIPSIVEEYAAATRNALEAGADFVEVHAANGYLPNQFLCDSSNQRTDAYGGSVENRARFLQEVLEACIKAAGGDAQKVGVRISPTSRFQDTVDSTPMELWTHVAKNIASLKLAYLHVVDTRDQGWGPVTDPVECKITGAFFREHMPAETAVFSAGGHDRASGIEYLSDNRVDAIVYGKLFLANPDLPRRFELDAKLNEPDRNTFYAFTAEGYTDYPALE
jgi:N-ethylmaleimide reductase